MKSSSSELRSKLFSSVCKLPFVSIELNRPFPSSKKSHSQNEAKCETFVVKMSFICIIIKNHFHINGFALRLALKVRFFGTRKWPIILAFLRLFNLLCFILHRFCESVILSCEFTLSKGKNFGETLRLQPWRYMSILLHLHLYEINYPSLADFAGDKNIAFDFSDACLFGHPDYFDYQDFLGFASD